MFLKGIFNWILGGSKGDDDSTYPTMASYFPSWSSETREYNYDVFPSFSGQDVRRTFLSHFLEGLKIKGIKTFIDNGIVRSESINSELIRAIRESRIAVVILSMNYPSSSWCLNELQLIMECRVSLRLTVMTIFYDVDPSDVRKQTGDFGKVFEETCDGKTEEQKKRWREALSQVAVIAGEHSVSWASEAEMIWKIVTDVSNELPSTNFDQLVGIESHVANMKSVIRLESDEVKIVGIWGPDGIGKTTIARALYNQISSNFQLKYYRELAGSNTMGLLNEILYGMLDHRNMKVADLQDAQYRLMHQRVLLVLDDVSSEELQPLLNIFQSLRFGSKVIVVNEYIGTFTNNGRLYEQIYKVSYPSSEEALQIFSYSAFGQSSPPRGYLKQAVEVSKLIAPFPLGLKVLGSALRGKSKEEWTMALAKLKTYLYYEDTEKAIRFAIDGLSEKHRSLFFSLSSTTHLGKNVKDSIYLLAKRDDWDVEKGIQTLADMALISISREGEIMMHCLVRRMYTRFNLFGSLE